MGAKPKVFTLLLLVFSLSCCGCDTLRIFWPDTGDAVTPDNPDTPETPLSKEVRLALGESGKEDARRFAAFYAVVAEEVERTELSVRDFRVCIADARDILGMGEYPNFKSLVSRKLEPYSKVTTWTPELRAAWADDLEELSAACLEASQ